MKKLLSAFAIFAFSYSAALAANPRTEIDETLIKFVAAINAGDAETVANFYTQDAALLPPDGERVDGRAAIREFWQGSIDSGLRFDKLHAVEVLAEGDLAGEVGVFTLTVPGDSGPTKSMENISSSGSVIGMILGGFIATFGIPIRLNVGSGSPEKFYIP